MLKILDKLKKNPPVIYKKERSKAFFKAAEKMTGYTGELPLSDEQRKKLLSLIVAQVNVAEDDAALQSATLGMQHVINEIGRELGKVQK